MKNENTNNFNERLKLLQLDCWDFGDIKLLRDSPILLIPEKYEIFYKGVYKGKIKLLFSDNECYINFIMEEKWNKNKNFAFLELEHAVLFLKEKQIEYLQKELNSKEN